MKLETGINNLKSFFNFDIFILPRLLKISFVFISIMVVFTFITGLITESESGQYFFIVAVIIMLFIRIITEITIILFKIYETLTIIKGK